MTNLNSKIGSGVSATPLLPMHVNSEVCSEAGFSVVRTLIRQAKSGIFLLLLGLLVTYASQAIRAQETSTITGTVTDQSGAVVANATVTATEQETGTKQSTVSNGVGLFDIPGLAVGHYTLSVTAQGFSSFQTTGVTVNAGQTVRQDVHLTVGSNSQTVTVEATALQVQTETNEVSRLISGDQVQNIATNGRNITSLTTLGTGVSWNGPSFNGVTAQNSVATISFNGLRPDHNNFLVNGGEVYDRGSGGKLGVLPSPDAIGQFQVLSSNYSPDYGIASGGTVLVELKSGTGRYHGGVWEFIRNDALDADYYFSKLNGTQTPELRLNIFGGNFGGPVPFLHKKTFFFVNEEWRRYIAGVNPTVTPTVPANDFPPAAGSNTPFLYFPWNCGGAGQSPCTAPIVPNVPGNSAYTALETGNGLVPGSPFPGDMTSGYTIPAGLLDQNSLRFMSTGAIPMPTPGTDTYTGSPKQPTYVREDVVRIDHNFNDRFHLMGSWIHDSMEQTIIPVQWSGDNYDTVGDVFNNPSWGTAIRLTQEISPSILNETGLYVNGNTINVSPTGIYAQPEGWDAGRFFTGNDPANKMPQIGFSGGPINTTWTVIYWPWKNSYLSYQVRDDLTWTRGKHTFKFGGSYMRQDKNQQLQADVQGDYAFDGSQYSGSSYLNFVLGLAKTYQQLQEQRTDYWLTNNYAGYATDNWRLLPRLTLNLGIRYDLMPHTYEKHNNVANFVPSAYDPTQAATFNNSGTICTTVDVGTNGCNAPSPGLATVNSETFYLNGMKLAGVNGFPRGLVDNDYFTWQPRIGFALDVRGNGKTVLRGGIGFFYERMQGNDIYNLDTAPPFSYQPGVNNVFFTSPSTSITNGATAAVPVATTSPVSMSYYYPHPATTQFSFGVQQQVAPAVVAAVQYVGSSSWSQNMRIETNALALNNLAGREAVATSCSGTWIPVDGVATCPNPNANVYRPYVGYGNLIQERNGANGNYNSLQAALRMENRHGLTLELAYTWSHAIDIQSADLTTANEAGSAQISNPYDIRYDRGSGLFDRRHIFNANYIYAEPFFRTGNALERTFLSGWKLSGVTVAQTGSPQNIYYNGPDVLGLGGNAVSRPNIVGAVRHPKTQAQWFSTSSFADPVAPWKGGANNGFGDAGKDTIIQPGLFNWNISVFKSFPLTHNVEGARFEFRAESFNTFNHTQFNSIDTGTADGTYGQVTNTYDPRTLQFGGKIMF
jgi:Carboxypeptidase regulatory-like domain